MVQSWILGTHAFFSIVSCFGGIQVLQRPLLAYVKQSAISETQAVFPMVSFFEEMQLTQSPLFEYVEQS